MDKAKKFLVCMVVVILLLFVILTVFINHYTEKYHEKNNDSLYIEETKPYDVTETVSNNNIEHIEDSAEKKEIQGSLSTMDGYSVTAIEIGESPTENIYFLFAYTNMDYQPSQAILYSPDFQNCYSPVRKEPGVLVFSPDEVPPGIWIMLTPDKAEDFGMSHLYVEERTVHDNFPEINGEIPKDTNQSFKERFPEKWEEYQKILEENGYLLEPYTSSE